MNINIDRVAIPIILSGLLVVGIYFYRKNVENFAQVLGTLENQRRFYAKCTDECTRNRELNFSETFSPMQLLCHQKCAIESEKRSKLGLPDLTPIQYQKHSEIFSTPQNDSDEIKFCLKEVEEMCGVNDCIFSKDTENCKASCIRVNNYKCVSGLSWSALQ